MIALIIYLSNTVFFPIYFIMLCFPLLAFRAYINREKINISFEEKIGFLLFSFCSVISIFIYIFFPSDNVGFVYNNLLGDFPYLFLVFFAILIAKFVNKNDLKLILYFTCFEIFIGMFEYYYGVSTFFENKVHSQVKDFADEDLLYYRRVFGLSTNSSVLAFKILLSFIIVFILRFDLDKKKIYYILFILLTGLVITFNRTTILSLVFGFSLYYIFFNFNFRKLIYLISGFTFFIFLFLDKILEQIFRGRGDVDFSGRDVIFKYYIDFIQNNFFIGNSGSKFWGLLNGHTFHAHNSFLQTIASNGFFIGFLFILGYAIVFYRAKIVLLMIFFYSCYQYGIFWGISFNDIVVAAIMYCLIDQGRKTVNVN